MGTKSATKLLRQVAGVLQELFAVTTSAGAADADSIPALNANGVLDPTLLNGKSVSAGVGDANKPILTNGSGILDLSMLPSSVGPDVVVMPTSDNLSAGNFVNIYSNAGVMTARKCDSNGKEANGFVLAPTTAPASATVYFRGKNDQCVGLTVGKAYLSSTPGAPSAAPETTSGRLVQDIGLAVTSTVVEFSYTKPITLA